MELSFHLRLSVNALRIAYANKAIGFKSDNRTGRLLALRWRLVCFLTSEPPYTPMAQPQSPANRPLPVIAVPSGKRIRHRPTARLAMESPAECYASKERLEAITPI